MKINNLFKDVGMVGTIIGLVMLILGIRKYSFAVQGYNAILTGAELFGKTASTDTSIAIWTQQMHNYKLVLMLGGAIFFVSVILLLMGLFKK